MIKPLLPGLAFAAAAFVSLAAPAGAADLPAKIAQRGTLIAAIVPNYPPLDLRDPATGKLTGFDVEFGEAVAQKLGVRMVWQETNFEEMIAAVKTGRVDLIISGMSDLKSREDTATFVDYLRSGSQFFTQASRAKEFPDPMSLCGKAVGASRRTALVDDIKSFSDKSCVPAGKPAIKVVGTEGSADARTQLRQARIDAAMQGGETLPYIMALEPNTYVPVGEPVRYTMMGIAVSKDDAQLQNAIADAARALMADGTYAKLADKWSLTPSMLKEITINAGE
jgi:polar amino acid transport system substrate-binding protein